MARSRDLTRQGQDGHLDESQTAYCGLCCGDCITSRTELFALVDDLERMLLQLRFQEYAALQSERNESFRDYPTFLAVLQAIRGLECPAPCREGGGEPSCAIRERAINGGCSGCWQCGVRRSCQLLDRLRAVHPNLNAHLDPHPRDGAGRLVC